MKHIHNSADIIWDEDFQYCVCRVCEQEWYLTEQGWKPSRVEGLNGTQDSADNQARRRYFAQRNAQGKKKGSLNRGGAKRR